MAIDRGWTRRAAAWAAVAALGLTAAVLRAEQAAQRTAELDRLRLVAAAHYENDDFKPAAETFRRLVALAPEAAADHFNLGLTLMRDGQLDAALAALAEAVRRDPELTAAVYVRGIVYKRQGRFADAVASLRQVIARDPQCFGAFYNLGLCYKLMEKTEPAAEAFLAASRLESEHPSPYYQLAILARSSGAVEDARRYAESFDRLRDTLDESEKTVEALERSRYSYVVTVPRLGQDLRPEPEAAVRFADLTPAAGLAPPAAAPPPLPARLRRGEYDPEAVARLYGAAVGGAVAVRDVDRDGRPDLYVARCGLTAEDSTNRLWRNLGGGRFADLTADFAVGDPGCGLDAVFGDYDNDGHDDLYVVNAGPNVLYRKQGDGRLALTGDASGPGLALVTAIDALPAAFALAVEMELRAVTGPEPDGFVVLDYRDAGSVAPEARAIEFKYVGARVGDGLWTIGHFDGAWHDEVRLESGIATGEVHSLRLRIEGGRVELLPGFAGGDKTLVHDFSTPLHRGRLGLGAATATARFDNLSVAPADFGEPLFEQRFAAGTAGGLAAAAGRFEVVDWGFTEVSATARVDEPQLGREAIFVDYDHDNDLDLYVVNDVELTLAPEQEVLALPGDFPGQVNTLLRNAGNGTFSDLTDEAGLLVELSQSRAVVAGDLDGDHDTDLVVMNANGPSRLFANQRLGRFALGGSFRPPLERDGRAVVVGDFNRDGHPDLVVAVGTGVLLYTNDGRASFIGTPLPLPPHLTATGISEIVLLDYNNDGWSDLLVAGEEGLGLLAATGPARFADVSPRVLPEGSVGPVADLAAADLDGDGDQDVAVLSRDRGLRLFVNQGGERRQWLTVELRGKKVNRNGYGATVEIAAEGHYQKHLVAEGRTHFGLGDLEAVDVVRVVWPNGVAQNVVDPGINVGVTIEEYVKVSASCGFLWAWNGSGFELVNEILGIGPLGAPIAPGVYHQPDSTELTLIAADQLVARHGVYELRLTEELRELMYADQVTLRVVDHPAELEIVPNEMFTAPPFPEDRFFAVPDARPPRAARDDRGRDVAELIRDRDGRYPTFDRVDRYDGLAVPHALTLDLGDLAGAERLVLFLDGWIYWPEASTVMAMAQDPEHALRPPELQVRTPGGEWEGIAAVGLPTSKGLVVPVDLSARLPLPGSEVRLVTNMSVYFDRIFVSTRDEASRCRVRELPVAAGELRYRGFSRLHRDGWGYERFAYGEVSATGSWSPPRGMLTRYGDVTPLLHAADDRYVIFGPGDELVLRFEAGGLPPLAAGWTREFIFYAGGWVKDGDLNTAHSETVGPLPFHGMSGYPYPETEHYPVTPETEAYRREYNTRPGVATTGSLPGSGSGD